MHVRGHGPAVFLEEVSSGSAGEVVYKVRFQDGSQATFSPEFVEVSLERFQRSRSKSGGNAASAPVVSRSPPLGMVSSPTAPRQLEYLGRRFNDPRRSIATPSATFSLVSTMVGGGVLSLPYAFSQCGLVLGTLCLVLAAAGSAWTLIMLVDCARTVGRDSFELVGYAAYGERSRRFTIALVFVLCWLTKVAYFVLLTDLLVPIAELIVPSLSQAPAEMVRHGTVCLAGLLLSPMCFKSNLSAVRFLCFASVGSVLVVGAIVGFRAFENLGREHTIQVQLSDGRTELFPLMAHYQMWPADGMKALYAFPTFGVSFLCHFNALPTHEELQRPTRYRMFKVIGLTLLLTTVLYFFVGTCGYLYAGCYTCGNILLNFESNDSLVAVGRGALGMVIMLNFPLICQPCRNALFRLLTSCGCLQSAAASPAVASEGPDSHTNSVVFEVTSSPGTPCEEPLPRVAPVGSQRSQMSGSPLLSRPPGHDANSRTQRPSPPPSPSPAQVHVYRREDTRGGRGMHPSGSNLEVFDAFTPKDEIVQQSASEPTPLQRYVLTALLLISSLIVSCIMKSIMVVWSVLGSTVCFLIGFILPAMYWRKLFTGAKSQWKLNAAAILAGFASVLGVICSILACINLNEPPCPLHQSSALEGARSIA